MIIKTNYTKEQEELLNAAANDYQRINVLRKYSEMKVVTDNTYEIVISQMQKIVTDMDDVLGNDKLQFTSLYRYHPNIIGEMVRTSNTGKMESIRDDIFVTDMNKAYQEVHAKLTEYYTKKFESIEIKNLFKVLHDACQEVFSQNEISGQDVNQLVAIIDEILPIIQIGVFLHIDRSIELNKALIAFRLHFISLDFIFQYIAEGNELGFDLDNIKLNDILYNPHSARVENANYNLDFTTVEKITEVLGIDNKTNEIKQLILSFNKALVNAIK